MMRNPAYNMAELKKFSEFDAANTAESFNSLQEYFDRLSDFVENAHDYLRGYTAPVIIYNNDMLKKFLNELEKTRQVLTLLGMTSKVTQLNYLNEAIRKKDSDTLSDGMMTFCAEMDDIAERISLTRISAEEANPDETIEQDTEKQLILAVDDKPELLTAIINALEGSFKVIAVTSGNAALKVIEKHTPALFLLDIEMPQMNGYELTRLIRQNKKFEKSPIFFLTSKQSLDYVAEAIKYGGNGYLLKPVKKELLLKKIQQKLVQK